MLTVDVDAGTTIVVVKVDPETVDVTRVVEATAVLVVVIVGPDTWIVDVVEVVDPGKVIVQGAAGTVVDLVEPETETVWVTSWRPMREEQNEEASSAMRTSSHALTGSRGSR